MTNRDNEMCPYNRLQAELTTLKSLVQEMVDLFSTLTMKLSDEQIAHIKKMVNSPEVKAICPDHGGKPKERLV